MDGQKEKGPNPCVIVEKSCDDSQEYGVGDDVVFNIKVTNCGDVDLDNVLVEDPITGFKWEGPLAAGQVEEQTTEYQITADDQANGLTNTVNVTATYTDPDSGEEMMIETSDEHEVPLAECSAELSAEPCETDGGQSLATVLTPFPDDVATVELARGQLGDGVFANGDTGLWDGLTANNEVPIDVPAHTAGCKLWLHVTGGQIVKTGIPTALTPSGSALVPILVSDMASPGEPGTGNGQSDIWQQIYCFSGDGVAGGQMLLELGNINSDNRGDHVTWVWSETCSETRALKPQDMKLGALIELESAPADGQSPKGNNPGSEFTVECPALIFGAGRHVLHPETNPDQSLVDASWFNTQGNAGAEVYDIVGHDSWQCQSGLGMDFMATAGTYSWDWSNNASTGGDSGWQTQAFAVVIPFTCEGCWLAEPATIEPCDVTISNDLCSGESASVKCQTEIVVDVVLAEGAELVLTPVIDGNADPSLSQTLVGPLSGPQTMMVESMPQDLPFGESLTCSIGAELEIGGGTAESTAGVTSTSSTIVPA